MFGKKSKRIKDLEEENKELELRLAMQRGISISKVKEIIELRNKCFVRNKKGQLQPYYKVNEI